VRRGSSDSPGNPHKAYTQPHRTEVAAKGAALELLIRLRAKARATRFCADKLQRFFAEDIRIALAVIGNLDDPVCYRLPDVVVALSDPEGDTGKFKGNTEDAPSLGVKFAAVKEWGDRHNALPLIADFESGAFYETFWLFEYPVFARPYALVVDRRSYGRKSKAEKLAHGSRPTRHSVRKSESIQGPEFFGGKHDL